MGICVTSKKEERSVFGMVGLWDGDNVAMLLGSGAKIIFVFVPPQKVCANKIDFLWKLQNSLSMNSAFFPPSGLSRLWSGAIKKRFEGFLFFTFFFWLNEETCKKQSTGWRP